MLVKLRISAFLFCDVRKRYIINISPKNSASYGEDEGYHGFTYRSHAPVACRGTSNSTRISLKANSGS